MATSPRVTQIISLLDACTPEEWGAVQQHMNAHPVVVVEEEHTLESITPAAIQRALEDDVLRVSAELQQPGEGGESPLLEVQIMAITGDVFPVQVSPDDTVRNRCQQQQDMNRSCVGWPGSGAGAAGEDGDEGQRKGGALFRGESCVAR